MCYCSYADAIDEIESALRNPNLTAEETLKAIERILYYAEFNSP